jgi:hypothetical protein
MNRKKGLLIALGAVIFAGVAIPVLGNQNDVEFRLAEVVRDSCYADAGYGDRYSQDAPRPPEPVMRKCTQPIRDWEAREPIRMGVGALAGLVALLPYLAILWLLRRRRREAQPA